MFLIKELNKISLFSHNPFGHM